FENAILRAPIEKVRRGDSTVPALLGVQPPKHRQAVRVGKRYSLDHPLTQHAEQPTAGAHTQREGQHGHEHQPGALPQTTQAVTQILCEVLKPIHAPCFADTVLMSFGAAELNLCAAPRFLARNTLPEQIFHSSFKMESHLVVQITLESRAVPDRPPE